MENYNAIVRLEDITGAEREIVLLKIDAANGRALVDVGSFDEHWIALGILDDSATEDEQHGFAALFERLGWGENDRHVSAEPSIEERMPTVARLVSEYRARQRRSTFRVVQGGRSE